jgi:hypothetical protein
MGITESQKMMKLSNDMLNKLARLFHYLVLSFAFTLALLISLATFYPKSMIVMSLISIVGPTAVVCTFVLLVIIAYGDPHDT